jgi:uncharacterized membrane protein
VAGAAVAILMPVTAPAVVACSGAAVGAAMGHAARGTNRGEARKVGASLDPGHAALIVVGLDGDVEKVRSALTRAEAFERLRRLSIHKRHGSRLQARLGGDAARCGCRDQSPIIALVLLGVGVGELDDRAIEG